MMRKIFSFFIVATAALLCAKTAVAQDYPAGVRIEVAECESDDNTYSIFSYKDDDGSEAYYLSIGRLSDRLKVESDVFGDFTVDNIDEFCLNIGTTADEAVAYLDTLLTMFDKEAGSAFEFPCRIALGPNKLGDYSTAECVVVKRFLQGKRLCFQFESLGRKTEADLTRMAVKSLRLSMKLEAKRKK